jgi:hypothetical protein
MEHSPTPRELAKRYKLAERSVPSVCGNSTVAIVRTKDDMTVPIGTGVLFRIADHKFVVTAAHVVRHAFEYGWGVAISGDNSKFVAVGGDWLTSPRSGPQPDGGLGDFAIYPLAIEQVAELQDREFANRSDVSAENEVRGFIRLLGFPQLLCEPSENEIQKVHLGAFSFSSAVHKGKLTLEDFDQSVHFLIDAPDSGLIDGDGKEVRLRSRNGRGVHLTKNLRGISGCGVWRIGKVGVSPEKWSPDDAALVGIAIATYTESEVIKVTRWRYIQLLIYEVFRDLRPALDIVTQHR